MGGEVRGSRACFPTPGHSKKDRGSWASIEPGAPDGVLVHCSNGGDPLEIKDLLRDAGILPPRSNDNSAIPWIPPQREPTKPASEHGVGLTGNQKIVATFEYFEADGALAYRKHRIEPGRHRDKEFFYDHLDQNGVWRSGRGGDPVPYRILDLISAPQSEPLYMAEGEAKADKLASFGLLATSHKDWKDEFGKFVAGRTVYILPDNDETGTNLASHALEAVESADGIPHLIRLPGLPPAGDILDWDGSADELKELAQLAAGSNAIKTLDLLALCKVEPRPKEFIIPRLAPAGEVTLFTGPGSAGKSLLAQQFSTAAAYGIPTLGFDIPKTSSIYLTCEDDIGQLHWRQSHICSAFNRSMSDLSETLHLASLRGEIGAELATFTSDRAIRPTATFDRLSSLIEATDSRLIFLDNVAHLFVGNENDRGEVTRFINLLNRLAGQASAALILLGHPNKNGDSYSGTTAWLNAVRSHFDIEHDPMTDIRTLRLGKANYARKGDQVRFMWNDWSFISEDELPPDKAKQFAESQQASADNELFLACLRQRSKEQRAVSEKPSSTYAPKVFARMPESKGIGQPRLEKALDRLFRIGKIERGELPWRTSDRKAAQGLREVRETARDTPAANAGDYNASP
ncbi:AAA family ATPase [Altererythrobacter lutimaris]|nr:AAA family ATPase [Altererythrobacter lutimaris]